VRWLSYCKYTRLDSTISCIFGSSSHTLLFPNHKSAAGAPAAKKISGLDLAVARARRGVVSKIGLGDVSSPDSFRSAPTGEKMPTKVVVVSSVPVVYLIYLQKVL